MLNLWVQIERVSSLLEPDERQSVLGDIQERGASLRALFELTALVALRQLQAWASWRPWVLAAALYFPARAVGLHTLPVASFLHSGHLLSFSNGANSIFVDPWTAVAAPALAWAMGFTLGRLGDRRAATLPWSYLRHPHGRFMQWRVSCSSIHTSASRCTAASSNSKRRKPRASPSLKQPHSSSR